MNLRAILAAMLLAGAGGSVFAESAWLESGDYGLRMDLALLNDAGVIRLPANTWPLAHATLAHAVGNARDHFATNAAVALALARVRARVDHAPRGLQLDARAAAGSAGLTRDFDTLAREDAELSGRASWSTERLSLSLNVTAAADPADGQELRADGSHATLALGNWLVSANTLERWWGPAHESSLILSNNARPMPTFMVERAEARAFETPFLSWLGPWRFNFAISQMEDGREDIESPLFMAWRVVIMPTNALEIGFSRTAQFCGKELACDWDSFFNMLAGNDNLGIDATAENEPGNQMAGFDMRWNSPLGDLPYAFYGQYIGEDESSYLPAKYLGQLGLEGWKAFADGSVLQLYGEYANTTCSALSRRGPYYDCSYNQGLFDVEGYRYRGRVIGHTTDSDSESVAVGAIFARANGDLWTAAVRSVRLNHDGVDPDGVDANNTVSDSPADYGAIELGWRGEWLGMRLGIDLGAEVLRPEGGERDLQPFGFVSWRHEFR